MSPIEKLKEIIQETSNIVFFGGAGVSTESGIPDVRSVDGLYNQKYDYPPETIYSTSPATEFAAFAFLQFLQETNPGNQSRYPGVPTP